MLENTQKQTAEFVKGVATYFRDFLETDFKKRRIPKRSIKFKNEKNFLIGLALKKYPTFNRKLWKLINNSFELENSFTVKKEEFKANIPISLQNLITKQADFVDEIIITEIINNIAKSITKESRINIKSPEQAYSNVSDSTYRLLQDNLVLPFVDKIRNTIEETSQSEASSIESTSEIEERLTEILIEPLKENILEIINNLILKNEQSITPNTSSNEVTTNEENTNDEIDENILKEISPILTKEFVQQSVKSYFEDFALSDLYYELNTLVDTKHMLDKQDIYLYFGNIRYENNNFPIFYVPIQINKKSDNFEINFDNVFYINKKALDFINQEYNKQHGTVGTLKYIADRIIYISEQENGIMPTIKEAINEICDKFNIQGNLDFSNTDIQQKSGLSINIGNSCFFCIFDKSDESIVNDYEDMMQIIDDGENILSDSFNKLIEDFIKKEPETITTKVESEWHEDTKHSEKLVYASPVPLNAEQRQILNALSKKNCKYVVVEGPPGTGKSHTITAITFEAIRNGQSVLVLSDKKEALDVAENKITETMDNVRLSGDIQNPILRLGKSGNTYTQILSSSSLEKIKEHSRAVEKTRDSMDESIENAESLLINSIEETILNNKNISIQDIMEMTTHEDSIEDGKYEFIHIDEFSSDKKIQELENLSNSLHFINNYDEVVSARTYKLFKEIFKEKNTINDYLNFLILVEISFELKNQFGKNINDIKIFKKLNKSNIEKLSSYLKNYNEIKKQIFGLGFLFKKSQVRIIDNKICNDYGIIDFNEPHKKISLLKSIEIITVKISERINYYQLGSNKDYEGDYFVDSQNIIKNLDLFDNFNLKEIRENINNIYKFISTYPNTSQEINLTNNYNSITENKLINFDSEKFKEIIDYLNLDYKLKNLFGKIPDFSFLDVKKQLENLVTTKTTQIMDKQVVEFAENSPSAAKTIKTIIKNKERFPKDEFEKLKKAFPCIIAGIRDYADYIPLESDIVDLVIIDEASQVSIAQAFPAILRANKILVMGDKKQFTNIKSNQAANITNNEYLNGLKNNFFQNIGRDPSQTQRLTKFDIKTSILDFFEFIHNYRTMLKKHFRGYPELISYSSKYFYDDSLQAVKVRGKLIDDVLKFEIIEHDDKIDLLELENSNKLESDFIISKLKEMKENGDKQTVGIITPFTNQQKFITSEISKLEEAEYFYEELKLKVMTFDGSQGEERDYIFYSMVVTPLKDNLNTIFIKSLANRDLEENPHMKVARLNVGFSRAKECMHFVLSKPVMEYTDEIGNAIKHYYRKLEDIKKGPDVDDVDKNSPMEAKVLSWIRETSFYNNNSENIDLQAQFPVGEYLKQIEKYYTHPKYKTDFLLSYKDNEEKYHQIIIEYDGFEYHFRNKEMVNELNYNHYYNEDDVYREKVLESYGYSFLRINRFNLGKEPVQTLNERLEKIVQKKSLQV